MATNTGEGCLIALGSVLVLGACALVVVAVLKWAWLTVFGG